MRRLLLFVFLGSMIGTLCSCSKIFSNEEYYMFSAAEMCDEASRIQDVFLTSFENKEVNKLYDEFSASAKERKSLLDEINHAFEYVDGNITTVETIRAGNNAGSKDENGYVEADYVASINVKTDKNRRYKINIHGIYFDRNNEQNQGIDRIYIYDKDRGYNEVTGEGRIVVGDDERE